MLSRNGIITSEVTVEIVPQLFFTEVGAYDPNHKQTTQSYFSVSDIDSLKAANVDLTFANKPTHYRNITQQHQRGIDEAMHFPLIVSTDSGLPFLIACDFLYHRYEQKSYSKEIPTTSTTQANAHQLAHMLNFFYSCRDDFDYLNFKFPIERQRPAYKYWQFLRKEIINGHMSSDNARLHQSISTYFFRYAQEIGLIDPRSELWREETINIQFNSTTQGRTNKQISRPVQAIKRNRTKSTSLDTNSILDGESLRPLNDEDQKILVTALKNVAPAWLKYLTITCLLTGGRLGSIGTLRERHIENLKEQIDNGVKTPFLSAGPIKTGIQTKNDKALRIYFPHIAIQYLDTYLSSEVRKKDVKKAEKKGLIFKNKSNQHVFINHFGNHVYWSKFDIILIPDWIPPKTVPSSSTSHYISDVLKPEMHLLGYKGTFKFHFTRATFGMNFLRNNYRSEMSNMEINNLLETLKELMGHSDIKTTQSYLNHYNSNLGDSPISLANAEFTKELLQGF